MSDNEDYTRKVAEREEGYKRFEAIKCDPEKYFITYCIEYNTTKCLHTCHYAQEMDGKLEKKV